MAEGVPEEADAPSPPEETGPAALSPGTRIAGYELGRRLGVGSMGAVYEGVRVADGRPVALKLLGADLDGKPTARARFLNEATLTARVPHPHVVAVIDSGEDAERAYLVMDLLRGEDLARRLRRTGPMSVGEVVDVIGPICDALASAHRAGVTHRDLKPSNIFLAVREEQLSPMLLDFGVATDEDPTGEGDRTSTRASTRTSTPAWDGLGTPMYLAPELVANDRAAGPASDQYALGAIVYEMLTGEPPYAADNLQQLLQTIAAGAPPSARARRPELPPKLDALVLRTMSADPQARFASVEDLGRALRAFAGSPVSREQPGRRRPPSSPAIAQETETPSPFVSTLVPEHEAKSGAWFVAPDADEIPEEGEVSLIKDWFEADLGHAEAESRDLPVEELGLDDASPGAEDAIEAAAPRGEDARPAGKDVGSANEAASPEESPAAPRARMLPAIDWPAISGFAIKHRRILVPSGIALLGITILFAVRGGRTVSNPVSAPPVALPASIEKAAPAAAVAPAAAENTAPTPAAPPAPAAPEKIAPAPAAPPTAAAAIEKTASAPAPAAPAVVERAVAPASPTAPPAAEKSDLAPPRPAPAPAISTRVEPPRDRPKPATRRERPAPVRAESPLPKAVSPAPAPKPRAPESAPVRMHNGVPLLD